VLQADSDLRHNRKRQGQGGGGNRCVTPWALHQEGRALFLPILHQCAAPTTTRFDSRSTRACARPRRQQQMGSRMNTATSRPAGSSHQSQGWCPCPGKHSTKPPPQPAPYSLNPLASAPQLLAAPPARTRGARSLPATALPLTSPQAVSRRRRTGVGPGLHCPSQLPLNGGAVSVMNSSLTSHHARQRWCEPINQCIRCSVQAIVPRPRQRLNHRQQQSPHTTC